MPSLNRRVSDLLVVGVTSADIAPGAVTFADVGTIYTSNLTEDTNLFFSNTRATVAVAAGSAANALLFVNAAGVLSNTSSLVWTGSNLGVGTATPRLNTANLIAGLTTLTVYNVASEGGGIELATGSSTATAVAGRLTFTSGANNNGFRTIAWIDSLIQGSTAGNQGGSLRFGVKPDNGTAAIALTIDSTGNIGIGKTPVFKLDVSADASINGVRIGLGAGAVSTNTALGAGALAANTTGDLNTAVGLLAMASNTSGYWNTAVGRTALSGNTTGYQNNALGVSALTANTTGFSNTAFSTFALQQNTTGSANVAVGVQALSSNTTASNNTAVGYQAGYTNQTGTENVYVGYAAGLQATGSGGTFVGFTAGQNTTTGAQNSAFGAYALYTNTTGAYNVALGRQALYNNTTASNNTAVGYQAAYSNTTGFSSTYVGYLAGFSTTTGVGQVAMGNQALYSNTTGTTNTALGGQALYSNTTASNNTAVGYQAGYSNTTGEVTAFGYSAGRSNTTGVNLTAIGSSAAYNNTTGTGNTAVGMSALTTNSAGINNTMVGYLAGTALTNNNSTFIGNGAGYLITTGTNNTILGRYTGNQGGLDIRTASNYIVLSDGDGNPRFVADSTASASIGTTSIGGGITTGWCFLKNWFRPGDDALIIGHSNASSGDPYMAFNYNGTAIGTITQNGTTAVAYNTASDYRLKNVDGPLTGSGEFIDALKPKIGTWKADGSRFVGFLAHEVQEVSPSSVSGEKDGERMQTMEYGSAEFIANIIAELQSLRARVAQLESKGA